MIEPARISPGDNRRFQLKPGHLAQSRMEIAARFPRPVEAIASDQPDEISHLLELVQETRTTAETINLAKHLPARAIQLIFPALALPAAAELPAKTIDRLLIILRERACPSLYPKAWVLWQQHFPHPLLSKALMVLCGILQIKQASSKPPVHPRVPLISTLVEIHGQATSRRLVANLAQKQSSFLEVLVSYAIDPAWPFGRSVLAETFLTGTAPLFGEAIDHLEPIFQAASAENRARIMRHFLELEGLPDTVLQRAHVVFYRTCGEPGSATPVWQILGTRERKAFASWIIRAKVGSHCLAQPEKAHFFLRYANWIRRVEAWDEQTLLIYFDAFVIADDNRYPDQALLYFGSEPNPHPGGLANPDRTLSPASPAIAHRRMESAIQQGDLTGIIQLLFDPEAMKQAGVLLDYALQSKMGRRPFFGK
ncbi:MAG: hypothetical protein PHQ83_10055 [Eubacteriales bacterium]|nr:hypothetical protein [Eubacteriales bacterium]